MELSNIGHGNVLALHTAVSIRKANHVVQYCSMFFEFKLVHIDIDAVKTSNHLFLFLAFLYWGGKYLRS